MKDEKHIISNMSKHIIKRLEVHNPLGMDIYIYMHVCDTQSDDMREKRCVYQFISTHTHIYYVSIYKYMNMNKTKGQSDR